MKLKLEPSLGIGTVKAPPSKSIAHRMLIISAMCDGVSRICGIPTCDDVLATVDCLRAMGVEIEIKDGVAEVKGKHPDKLVANISLKCRESGSTLRFLVPIAMLSGEKTVFECAESLISRPHSVYEALANEKGLIYSTDGNKVTVSGRLTPGNYRVAGNLSSQFISGLLLALPTLDGDSRIIITTEVESLPYIDMTLNVMAQHGVRCNWESDKVLFIKGGQSYQPKDLTVEGDYSGACFIEALNLLGSHITVKGLSPDSIQGDKVYKDIFPQMALGCPTVDISNCPDLGPILFALGAALNGVHLVGINRLRLKESDRVSAMKYELEKLGATVKIFENEAVILPSKLRRPSIPLSGHGDHRIVMALSVLLTLTGGEITDAEAVEKSYPDFFKVLGTLGFFVTECD